MSHHGDAAVHLGGGDICALSLSPRNGGGFVTLLIRFSRGLSVLWLFIETLLGPASVLSFFIYSSFIIFFFILIKFLYRVFLGFLSLPLL